MTGCEWCGVGPDDECEATCSGGVTDGQAGRAAAWLADRFGGTWYGPVGGVDLAYVTLGDLEVSVRGCVGGRMEVRVPEVVYRITPTAGGPPLAVVCVEARHWVHGARACEGVLAGLVGC